MNSKETKKVLLKRSLEVLLRENDSIRSKIKGLHEKHASNHRKIELIMEEISSIELQLNSVKRETIWEKFLRQLSKLFFGGKTGEKIRKIASTEKLLSEEEEEPSSSTENMLRRGRSNPSLCKPMELEDAILTVEGEPLTKRSGSVQTIKDTEELFREMTPSRKKIKIVVEKGDLDQEDLNTSNKKLISPKDSFEENVVPPCAVVVLPILPSSSFGKDIRHDLTGYGASSTPVSGDSSGPAVFLFGGQTETSSSSPTSGGQAAGEEEILTEEARAGPAPVKKTPLTLEER